MKRITRIKLLNFKRFQTLDLHFDDTMNIFIGDNEAGKSSILEGIDIVLSGSRSKVETIGLANLFNQSAVHDFFAGAKKPEDLPMVQVELYLNEQHNPDLCGKNNSEGINCDGLFLTCQPSLDYGPEIKKVLDEGGDNFPYEFYSISFKTFADQPYSGYRKYLRHLLLDHTQINNEYATKSYISTLFQGKADTTVRSRLENEYRKLKSDFKQHNLHDLNAGEEYEFAIRTSSKANLESDLSLVQDNVMLENRGKGKQCFIRTDFALQKSEVDLDVALLEEPENHLSHIWMKKLIKQIQGSSDKQLFIATHSNLISSRLDLRKCIMLNAGSQNPVLLKDIPEATAQFFMKAPDNNLLEFIMSKKVILVEGDAEFILMEAFFKTTSGESLADSDIHVISVGGKSFKRYLEVARVLEIKTAVVTDNDGDYDKNIEGNYADYDFENCEIFADKDPGSYTFEVAVFTANEEICDDLFSAGRKTLSVQEFMLQNKAQCAFDLLSQKGEELTVPAYIKEAIEWIRS